MIAEFADFARREIADGGPEPELAPIVWLTRDSSDVEKVWAAGVYCSHHCVPSAMVVWKHWRPEQVVDSEDKVEEWLRQHWDALPVRNEMRSHRMPTKRAICLRDFARYALDETWRIGDYDEVWADSIGSVKYFGRYVAIKYMEFLRRMVRPDLILTDVRIASGAWSVREGLANLYPDEADVLANRDDNSYSVIQLAERRANDLLFRLQREHDLTLSHFDVQVLLCEHKQHLRGTFFPGKSHIEEAEFAERVETQFSIPEFWEARRILFPKIAANDPIR